MWTYGRTQQQRCLDVCLSLSMCTCNGLLVILFLHFSIWIFKQADIVSYRPRSKLSRGLNVVPSSPPCSGSAAGWCPPPWSASSLWIQPPPPAAARRLQTLWTEWSTHGCCMYSSGRQIERARGVKREEEIHIKTGKEKMYVNLEEVMKEVIKDRKTLRWTWVVHTCKQPLTYPCVLSWVSGTSHSNQSC